MKIVNRTIASLVLLANIFFLKLTFLIFQGNFGYMGYGMYILIISLPINLLIIPALIALINKYSKNRLLLVLNLIGLLWIFFWVLLAEHNELNWLRI